MITAIFLVAALFSLTRTITVGGGVAKPRIQTHLFLAPTTVTSPYPPLITPSIAIPVAIA